MSGIIDDAMVEAALNVINEHALLLTYPPVRAALEAALPMIGEKLANECEPRDNEAWERDAVTIGKVIAARIRELTRKP